MALRSDDARWGSAARTFHWLMAILIITLGCVGLYMADLPRSPQKIQIYALHKSIGLTVLALALLRLSWRLFDARPRDVPMPRWQAAAAHGAHAALYVLMLVLPLSGWLYNSASGYPLQWFGLFNLPSLTGGSDEAIKAMAHALHEYGWWLLVAVITVHAAGALKHHFVDRDGTLARMLPWRTRLLAPAAAPSNAPDPIPAPPAPTSPENTSV